jgi:energy-coupling factor transport system ATP-binding protein
MENGEPIIRIKNLCYKPLTAPDFVIRNFNLEVMKGDFILLLGPSGCGKSILVRCLNGLIPSMEEGDISGMVEVNGMDTQKHRIHEFSPIVGMVFQNPDDQILSLRVSGEVAYGVENQGMSHEVIVHRVDECMQLMGIEHLKNRLTFAISGGQKQRVSIASNIAMDQEVLILDDPTTDLDPIGKSEIVFTLQEMRKIKGRTLIVIEHELNDLIEMANRVIVMDHGGVIIDASPQVAFAENYSKLTELGINIPQHIEICNLLQINEGKNSQIKVMKEEAFEVFRSYLQANPKILKKNGGKKVEKRETVVSVDHLNFAYNPASPLLQDVNFNIHSGEFVAIIGANGSGKSTLVNNLIGLLKPDSGQINVNGHDIGSSKIADVVEDIGYVFQNPDHQLFCNTVDEELRFSLRTRNLPIEEIDARVEQTLNVVGLSKERNQHPFSLSRGQRQKLAVATALIHHPKLILLDEPTTGQDRRSLAGLLDMLSSLNEQGNTTVIVTHDMDIVARYATRILVMKDGKVILDGTPEEVFYEHFEELTNLNLKPPTLIDFCHRNETLGCPRFLYMEEFIDCLQSSRGERSS